MKFEQVDQASWDAFVESRGEANFLHSWQWGSLHETLGDKVHRLGAYKDDKIVGVAAGIVKNARRSRYMEVPGGPLMDWENEDLATRMVDELADTAKQEKCVFVRVRPQTADSSEARAKMNKLGFTEAKMHLHAQNTTVIDLLQDEDKLLENMRQQTRYEVRKSDKQDVKVSFASTKEQLKAFFDNQHSTAVRQGFIPPSMNFLSALLEAFGDNLRIYRADKDGQLLTMALIVVYGIEADYFEGASTLQGRKFPGAYGLQWQVIQDMKKLGLERYNLWGITDGSSKHRYAGVTTFKRGFGGSDVNFVPAHDLVLNRPRYAVNWVIETVRKKSRGL